MLQVMCEADEVTSCGSRWLQFLRHVCHSAAYLIHMMYVQRQATNLYRAGRQGHETQHDPQERCLTATTLARKTHHPPCLDSKVEVTEQLAVTKGEGGRAKG